MFWVLVRVSQVHSTNPQIIWDRLDFQPIIWKLWKIWDPHNEITWNLPDFCMDLSWNLLSPLVFDPTLWIGGLGGLGGGLRTHEDSTHRPKIQVKSVLFVALVSFTLGVVTLILLGPAEPGYPPKYGQIPEKTIWWSPPVFGQFLDGSNSFVRYVGGWSIH